MKVFMFLTAMISLYNKRIVKSFYNKRCYVTPTVIKLSLNDIGTRKLNNQPKFNIELFNERYTKLKDIFVDIPDGNFRPILLNSSRLIEMDNDTFDTVISNMNEIYPYIDPWYMLSFKSIGIEMLLIALSEKINIQERKNYLRNIDEKVNIDNLIRYNPYILSSQYCNRFENHIQTLMSNFQLLKKHDAIKIIQKYPVVLYYMNLNDLISIIFELLRSYNIISSKNLLMNLLIKEPKLFNYSFIDERINYLLNHYSNLNLKEVIKNYPRILVCGTVLFYEKYNQLTLEFGSDYNINELINKHPVLLDYKATSLKYNLIQINKEFPSLYPKYILENVPRLLTDIRKDELIKRIHNVRSLFTLESEKTSINNDIELTREESVRIISEIKLNNIDNNNDISDLIVTTLQNKNNSSINANDQILDVGRIIFGNIDLFIDSYNFFLKLIKTYVKELDEVLAYTILTAVPDRLTKNPNKKIIDDVKFLYGKIVQNKFIYSNVTVRKGDNHHQIENTQEDVNSLYSQPNTVFNRGKNYDILYLILREAPKILRYDTVELSQRFAELCKLFDCDIDSSIPILSAPRLFTETSLSRVYNRKILLSNYIDNNIINTIDVNNNNIIYLISSYPKLLTFPTASIYSRIPFISNLLNRPISFEECYELLQMNTNEFITHSASHYNIDNVKVKLLYSIELISHIMKYTDMKDDEIAMDDCNSLEMHFCGILNKEYDK